LRKAEGLGNRLLPAFNTSSGLPVTHVHLRRSVEERARIGVSDEQTNLAEAGTLSLEFTTLGRLTGARGRPGCVGPRLGEGRYWRY
jgi:hypothetical protein